MTTLANGKVQIQSWGVLGHFPYYVFFFWSEVRVW